MISFLGSTEFTLPAPGVIGKYKKTLMNVGGLIKLLGHFVILQRFKPIVISQITFPTMHTEFAYVMTGPHLDEDGTEGASGIHFSSDINSMGPIKRILASPVSRAPSYKQNKAAAAARRSAQMKRYAAITVLIILFSPIF